MFKLAKTIFEAGVSAFDNFLNQQQNSNPFRSGALVNVIFVSDTHDIGVAKSQPNSGGLLRRRNSYSHSGLSEKVKSISNIRSLKFHAIAPVKGQGHCADEKDHGIYLYSKLVEESGGKQVHCSGADYVAFISDMVKSSMIANKTIPIPEDLTRDKIDYVEVNGESMDYELDEDKNVIIIKNVVTSDKLSTIVEIVLQ